MPNLKAVAPLEIEKSGLFHLCLSRDSNPRPLKHGTTGTFQFGSVVSFGRLHAKFERAIAIRSGEKWIFLM